MVYGEAAMVLAPSEFKQNLVHETCTMPTKRSMIHYGWKSLRLSHLSIRDHENGSSPSNAPWAIMMDGSELCWQGQRSILRYAVQHVQIFTPVNFIALIVQYGVCRKRIGGIAVNENLEVENKTYTFTREEVQGSAIHYIL